MKLLTYWLTLIFIFTIPFENRFVDSAGASMTRLIGVLAFASWLVMLAVTNRIRKPNPYIIVSILFLLWSALSTLWSDAPAMTVVMTITYTQLVLMTLVIWNVFTTREMVQGGLWAYLLGAYITAGMVVRNFAVGFTPLEGLTLARYTAGGQDPNDLGVLLAMGVPIAIWLGGVQNLNKALRFLTYLYVPVAMFGILLTASRTALIALVIGLLFAFVMPSKLKLRTRIIVFALLIGALFYILPLVPSQTVERLGGMGDSVSSGDLTGRGAIWAQGIALFVENPIIGVGSGAFSTSIDLHRPSHNVAITIAAEFGIIGIFLFGTMGGLVVLAAFRHPSPDRYLWLAILACWLIGAMSLNWEFRKQTWVLFALTVASAYPVADPVPSLEHSSPPFSEPMPASQPRG